MLIIGITGSIGMGKTTVSKMLEILKIPVFDSDKKVKEILEKNSEVINKILKIWPDTVLKNQKQAKIDKVALSNNGNYFLLVSGFLVLLCLFQRFCDHFHNLNLWFLCLELIL